MNNNQPLEAFIRCPKCRHIPHQPKPKTSSGVRKCRICGAVFEYAKFYTCKEVGK